ncbi:cytochrome c [Sphingomonas piscis]|uniref:Cytochrome c n=1 Tax=Sphingomonas piscis TaxID=2714943 RepID=A0A6G7YNA2_9SPHN|nr:cytochrome c [Sphingomonas piscis]QIK78223.1 cytochrome c [Sphingomonas piscis]
MQRLLIAAASFALLAGCNSQADGNEVLNEANASGEAASATVENSVAASSATPLQKEQALALMKERHENYEKIGKAMRAAKKSLDGNDVAGVREAAATINELAPKAATWFPAGTGPDIGKTDAKAEIWQQPEVFAKDMANLRDAASAFNQAAQGSDIGAMTAAHAKLGGTCKSCHERFKERD